MRCAKVSAIMASCILFAMLVGCKSTGQHGEVQYNMFYGPDDHIAELLAEGKVDEASAIYNAHSAVLDPTKTKDKALIDELARALRQDIEPKIASLLAGFGKTSWPAPHEDWLAIRALLDDAEQTIERVQAQSVLALEGQKPAGFADLAAARTALIARIEAGADEAFAAYPIFEDSHFFSDYPTPLEAQGFLAQNRERIQARLAAATPRDIAAMYATYRDDLGEACQASVAENYFCSLVGGDPKAASIAALLKAAADVRQADMPLARIEQIKIAVVNVTSPTLIQQKQLDFPLRIEVDMPFDVEAAPLEKAFDGADARAADVLVVMSVAMARADRDMTEGGRIPSVLLAGFREVENPDYLKARLELEQAMVRKNAAEIQASIPSTDPFAGISRTLESMAASNRVKDLTEELVKTPRTIKEPIFKDYAVRRIEVDSTKHATVNYYVIDKRSMTMFSDVFDARASNSFSVLYDVHELDVYQEELFAQHMSEEDVLAYERDPLVVPLSAILAEFGKGADQATRIASLEEVMGKLVADRNVALASAASRTFSDARNDPRFDHVVKVLNPTGGFGSGFYVAEDMVMTNYHVIEGTRVPVLRNYDGIEMTGTVVAHDVRLDLALIKVSKRGIPATFYADTEIPLGSQIDLIGHPRGFDFTITRGVVSAVRHGPSLYGNLGKPVLYVQSDVASNPGNSGGPAFVGDKIVAVCDWGRTDSQNITFFIHYSEVLEFMRRQGVRPRI